MNRAEYHTYLASREWAILKKQVRERSGNRCERCRRNSQHYVHHKTYERLGHELLDDLQALCGPCHEFVSGVSDDDPMQQPQFHNLGVMTGWEKKQWLAAIDRDDEKEMRAKRRGGARLFYCENSMSESWPEKVMEIKQRIDAPGSKLLSELIEHVSNWELDGVELRVYFPKEKRSFAELMECRDSLEKLRNVSSEVIGRSLRICIRLEAI